MKSDSRPLVRGLLLVTCVFAFACGGGGSGGSGGGAGGGTGGGSAGGTGGGSGGGGAQTVSVTSVTVKSATTIQAGGTEQLTATLAPADATDQAVTWSSSNSAVATVSAAGLVTAVEAGSATITVTTHDGSKTAACAVTVTAVVVSVSSVSLDHAALALVDGATATLTASILPAGATNQSVTWSTSSSAIASISSTSGGTITVTASGVGSATITVTSAADATKQATCTVTVSANVTPVASVALDQATLALTAGGTASLTATVLPANATDPSLTWSTSDGTVASISATSGGSITVTAAGAGTATITATSNADSSKTASCAVTVTAAGSSDDNLTALVLLDATNTLSPPFSPSVTNYTANVASVVPSVRVQATLSDAVNATMTVNGTAATSGTATTGIALTAGANTLSIVVTAQNGATQTYTVTVIEASPVDETPASWTGAVADLFGTSGTAPTGSIGNNQPNTLTMTAAGGEVNSTNRRYYLAYAQVSGDFQLTGRLTSITGTISTVANNAFRYGLFMTENIAVADSWVDAARFAELDYFSASTTPTLTPSRAYKLDVGAGSAQSRSTIASAPLVDGMTPAAAATVYLRLTRLANKFVVSFSTDNSTYTTLNTSTFLDVNGHPLADTWDVGFYAAPKDSLTFTYDTISIIR